MPAIVDHDEMRMQILEAFQRCITAKPITQISLRDIAAEAGMSHAKLLYYFKNKDELIISYVKYTKDYMTEKFVAWFKGHPRAEYESNLAYMNAFMEYVAAGQAGEVRPNATTQTYVLARYSPEIEALVRAEFLEWRTIMEQCLSGIYGPEAGAAEAEAMMILIAGTFICNYNKALTGRINGNIIGCLSNLSKS